MHVTDIDPDRPGLEIFTVHEGATFAPYGMAMRDAATGEVLFGAYSGRDTGRGMIGDVAAGGARHRVVGQPARRLRGARRAHCDRPADTRPHPRHESEHPVGRGPDHADRQRARSTSTPTIDDWQRGTLLTAEGTRANNGTKGNPSLVADIFGDWREELLLRTVDSSAIRIYLSTELTPTSCTR